MSCVAGVASNSIVLTLGEVTSSVTAYAPSLRYMRKMLPLMVHNIIYHRIDLEENLFVQKSIKDFKYKTFKSKTKHRIVSNVYHWCRSIAQAISKKCMKHIYLLFMKTDDNSMIEHYKFTLEYSDQPEMTVDGATLLAETKNLFEVISTLSNHNKLISDEITVLVELEQNNNGRLKLPNFEMSPTATIIDGITSSQYISLGTINTGYHSLACDAQGEIFQQNGDAEVIEIDDNREELNTEEEELLSSSVVNKREQDLSDEDMLMIDEVSNDFSENPTLCVDTIDVGDENPKKRKADEELRLNDENEEGFECEPARKRRKDELSPVPIPMESMDTYYEDDDEDDAPLPLDKFRDNAEIDCMCGLALSLGISGTVACMVCPRLQHVVCAGFEKIENMPRSFICASCGTRSRPITDFKMKGRNPGDVMFFSRVRLVMAYCFLNKKYPEELIENWEEPLRKQMKERFATTAGLQINADNTISISMCDSLRKVLETIFYDYGPELFTTSESMTL